MRPCDGLDGDKNRYGRGSERATRSRCGQSVFGGFQLSSGWGGGVFYFTSSTLGQNITATSDLTAETQSASLSRYNGEALCMLLRLGLDIRPQPSLLGSCRRPHAQVVRLCAPDVSVALCGKRHPVSVNLGDLVRAEAQHLGLPVGVGMQKLWQDRGKDMIPGRDEARHQPSIEYQYSTTFNQVNASCYIHYPLSDRVRKIIRSRAAQTPWSQSHYRSTELA